MALQDIPLPFGEWLPDLGENENPGLVEAKNVIARPGGYAPIRGLQSVSVGVANGAILNAAFGYQVTSNSNPTFDYSSAGNLFRGTVATSVPPVTNGYYRFARYKNYIFASAKHSALSNISRVWYHDVADTTFTNIASAGLQGLALARVGDFMMLGNCNVETGTVGADPYSFRWSAFNNPLDWAPSQTTQAGIATVQDPEYGAISGLWGGKYSLIFQTNGLTRIDYVGPPKVWNATEVSPEFGCAAQDSIVGIDGLVYFFSKYGVCVTNGVSVELLGDSRVNNWIVDNTNFSLDAPRVSAGILWDLKQIVWAINDGTIAGNTRPYTKHLFYSLETGRFTFGDFTSYGAIRHPPDGGELAGYMVNYTSPNGYLARKLNQDTLAAELTTGYTSLAPGRRVSVNNVEPIYDGSGAKVAVNTKATQAGAVSAGTPVAVNSDGIADLRADGRLAAVSVTFDAAAEWSELKGAVVTADVSGAR